MLNYQSSSFHDALYLRALLGLRPAPEFAEWQQRLGLADEKGLPLPVDQHHKLLQGVI